jgi:hypothetical protein
MNRLTSFKDGLFNGIGLSLKAPKYHKSIKPFGYLSSRLVKRFEENEKRVLSQNLTKLQALRDMINSDEPRQ